MRNDSFAATALRVAGIYLAVQTGLAIVDGRWWRAGIAAVGSVTCLAVVALCVNDPPHGE